MKLKLHRVLGYEGSTPVLGMAIATFIGNQKKCVNDAKKWLKENPQPIAPAYKWEQ